jgi:hypothetical protein
VEWVLTHTSIDLGLATIVANIGDVDAQGHWPMRLKSPAVSMAFFKVAAGNPVITVPLPTRAGNGVPSAKTVPGADTKICHLTEPEFNTPYKRAQMRASFSLNHACSVVLNCTSKQKKLLFLLRTSKKIKIAEFKHTRFHNGF